MIGIAAIVFIALYFVDAPYGAFTNKTWGKTINNKLAWFLMEFPIFLAMIIIWLCSPHRFAGKFYTLLDPKANALSQKTALEIMDACPNTPRYEFNTQDTLQIRDFGSFFRSINHYLIRNNLAKGIYVQGLGKQYDQYKEQILSEDLSEVLAANNLTENDIKTFAEELLHTEAPVFVIWEPFLDERGIMMRANISSILRSDTVWCCAISIC